ncbi:integrase core domain-containing protein [Candidatus Poriferisodalis sp.]|uniref:integrase core domain-containing protein n=1 Tax=Candidatus Poriferisodalis sp. TaxID=3101277 RepID=UPI003C6F72C0
MSASKVLTLPLLRRPVESAQCLAKSLRRTAAGWGLAQSVGSVGSSADNAVAEAFFSTLKRELVHRHNYPGRATARRSIFEWLARYNTARRHTSLGCLTPDQHEHQHRQTTGKQPALTT